MSVARVTLNDLERIVGQRASADAAQSYTRSLLDRGVGKCAQKVGEEAVETVIAATSGSDEELIAEASDLLYHLCVLLHARDIPLERIEAELARRTSQSGHQEKASRPRG